MNDEKEKNEEEDKTPLEENPPIKEPDSKSKVIRDPELPEQEKPRLKKGVFYDDARTT